VLIRPALGPAAIAVAVVTRLNPVRSHWTLPLYLIPLSMAVALLASLQWHLYGHPLRAGYGQVTGLFAWQAASANLSIFGRWAGPTLGVAWFAFLALGVAVSRRGPRLLLALVAVAVTLPYVFYRPYDHWETLRFLLPIVAVATPLVAAGLLAVARHASASLSVLLAALVVAAVAWSWTLWLGRNQVFTMPVHEARHRLAGEMVAQTTPASAVIIALQHSGSLRYYSGRQTLNWSGIPAAAFAATVRVLREQGRSVYVMIDSDAERALFVEQHGDVLNQGWLPAGQRRSVQLFEAR
jgi:hypothetical protein